MKIGRQFAEERMYSKNEEERLYSTGNDELDELLERAFCEGYEYAQREFAEKKEEGKKKHTGAKVAGIAGGAVGTTALSAAGVAKLGENAIDKGAKAEIKKGAEKVFEGAKKMDSAKVTYDPVRGKKYRVDNLFANEEQYHTAMKEGKELADRGNKAIESGTKRTAKARRAEANTMNKRKEKAVEDIKAGAKVIKRKAKKLVGKAAKK